MRARNFFRSRGFAVVALAAFVLLVSPVREVALAQAAAGSLVGFVYDKDMKTPVANAVVKLRSLQDQKEYTSTPSDPSGMYKVAELPPGRYIVGVSAKTGDYNFNYYLNIKGSELAKLSVALVPGAQEGQAQGGGKSKSFFTSPVGIMLMLAAAGIVLYAVFGPEEEASPIR
jgi:hypothetical protein